MEFVTVRKSLHRFFFRRVDGDHVIRDVGAVQEDLETQFPRCSLRDTAGQPDHQAVTRAFHLKVQMKTFWGLTRRGNAQR